MVQQYGSTASASPAGEMLPQHLSSAAARSAGEQISPQQDTSWRSRLSLSRYWRPWFAPTFEKLSLASTPPHTRQHACLIIGFGSVHLWRACGSQGHWWDMVSHANGKAGFASASCKRSQELSKEILRVDTWCAPSAVYTSHTGQDCRASEPLKGRFGLSQTGDRSIDVTIPLAQIPFTPSARGQDQAH